PEPPLTNQPQRTNDLLQPGHSPGSIVSGDGWRAAIGDLPRPVLAHLRLRTSLDIVGVNTQGVTFALDAATGIVWWRPVSPVEKLNAAPVAVTPIAPVLIQTRNGLDSLVVFFGNKITALEGCTGPELWRAT